MCEDDSHLRRHTKDKCRMNHRDIPVIQILPTFLIIVSYYPTMRYNGNNDTVGWRISLLKLVSCGSNDHCVFRTTEQKLARACMHRLGCIDHRYTLNLHPPSGGSLLFLISLPLRSLSFHAERDVSHRNIRAANRSILLRSNLTIKNQFA